MTGCHRQRIIGVTYQLHLVTGKTGKRVMAQACCCGCLLPLTAAEHACCPCLLPLQDIEPEVRTFNTAIIACNMCGQPQEALKVSPALRRHCW